MSRKSSRSRSRSPVNGTVEHSSRMRDQQSSRSGHFNRSLNSNWDATRAAQWPSCSRDIDSVYNEGQERGPGPSRVLPNTEELKKIAIKLDNPSAGSSSARNGPVAIEDLKIRRRDGEGRTPIFAFLLPSRTVIFTGDPSELTPEEGHSSSSVRTSPTHRSHSTPSYRSRQETERERLLREKYEKERLRVRDRDRELPRGSDRDRYRERGSDRSREREGDRFRDRDRDRLRDRDGDRLREREGDRPKDREVDKIRGRDDDMSREKDGGRLRDRDNDRARDQAPGHGRDREQDRTSRDSDSRIKIENVKTETSSVETSEDGRRSRELEPRQAHIPPQVPFVAPHGSRMRPPFRPPPPHYVNPYHLPPYPVPMRGPPMFFPRMPPRGRYPPPM